MPLPTGDTQWPPRQLAAITPKLAEWAAWYSGDTEALGSVYGGYAASQMGRPSQYRGGVVGTVARWFWGQPTPTGQQRTKLHVPVASDIAAASSDLLFGEELQLDFNGGSADRIEQVLEHNNWMATLAEAGEVASALGGAFLRVGWDDQVADHALLTTVHADAALPEFRHGRLVAVTFWQVVESNDYGVTRYLERHERGRIEYGLYVGTTDSLGRRVPLTESAASAGLTVDAESGVDTGHDRLTVEYLPNIRPQRKWRNDPLGSNLGRSDLEQQEPLMDALDETYTSWMRDVRLGRGRLLVPSYMLESNGVGQGATFDMDREVFTSLNIPPSEDGGGLITPQQFEIRHEEHAATAKELLEQILRGAGYGPGLFGLGGDVAQTATEVDSRDARSRRTREKKTRYASGPVARIIEALAAVDAAKFGTGGRVDVSVEFPEATPSLNDIATSVEILNRAVAVSTDTKVRMLHPDWDDTKVGEEVGKILAQEGMSVPEIGAPPPADAAGFPAV